MFPKFRLEAVNMSILGVIFSISHEIRTGRLLCISSNYLLVESVESLY